MKRPIAELVRRRSFPLRYQNGRRESSWRERAHLHENVA
jgi:hypothetical protein